MEKKLAIILIAASLACSCSPKVIEHVRTEVVTQYRDSIIHDTTTFTIETIIEKNITRDTVSHLENKYAKSDALVSNGFLSHSLESIPQVIKVPFEVHVRDTITITKESEVITETKYVEKKLNLWQKTRLYLFPFMLLLLLWAYRKEIAGLIKKIVMLI